MVSKVFLRSAALFFRKQHARDDEYRDEDRQVSGAQDEGSARLVDQGHKRGTLQVPVRIDLESP